jgi:hypothetical protein
MSDKAREDLLEIAALEYLDQLEGADLKERIFALIDEHDTEFEVESHAQALVTECAIAVFEKYGFSKRDWKSQMLKSTFKSRHESLRSSGPVIQAVRRKEQLMKISQSAQNLPDLKNRLQQEDHRNWMICGHALRETTSCLRVFVEVVATALHSSIVRSVLARDPSLGQKNRASPQKYDELNTAHKQWMDSILQYHICHGKDSLSVQFENCRANRLHESPLDMIKLFCSRVSHKHSLDFEHFDGTLIFSVMTYCKEFHDLAVCIPDEGTHVSSTRTSILKSLQDRDFSIPDLCIAATGFRTIYVHDLQRDMLVSSEKKKECLDVMTMLCSFALSVVQAMPASCFSLGAAQKESLIKKVAHHFSELSSLEENVPAAAADAILSPSMQSRVVQATSYVPLISDASPSVDSSPENFKFLKQILLELDLLDRLPIFLDNFDTDAQLASLSTTHLLKLTNLYKIPQHLTASFCEKCRIACKPVDAGHERWLKACLILRACARGVRPFVGAVMMKLHRQVIHEVREIVCEYKSECDDSDWRCESLPDEQLRFDDRPSLMQLVSLQHDGTATTDVPHRLGNTQSEPFLFSKRNSKGIFAQEEADDSGLLNLFMRSLPADASTSKVESEKQLVLQKVFKWDTPYLEPFQVHCEDGATFTVVYCQCKIDGAPLLVANAGKKVASSAEHAASLADSAHLAHELQSHTGASASERKEHDLYCRFWTIEKKNDVKYKPHDHSLLTGNIVSFSGKGLPEGIISGHMYTILISALKPKLRTRSFDVCSTLIPSNPFSDVLGAAEPRIRILRPAFPIGLYRDAVYRYHTKGEKSDLSKRWEGIEIRLISTDYCEFAKCFCSKSKKDLKNYFAPDEERSPELLYNMIMHCKAFHTSTTDPIRGFCSIFCNGDEMRKSQLEPILDSIQHQADILRDCRNKICHGDFHSFEQAEFDRLKQSSDKMLKHIEEVADIMNHADHAQTFQHIREVVSFQHREIFHDDFSQHPPRLCILNRRIELTSEERQHFNKTIQNFQHEIRSLHQSMENRRFDRLPVCMIQDISDQILTQEGKRGREGIVYNVEIWGEMLAVKIFRDTDPNWRRELNSLTALLHMNIVQVKYVIYDGFVTKQREDPPIGYVMERMDCSLYDYSKDRKLSLKHLLFLLQQVALALAYTHANNIAHMDIKPENILLDESKNVAKLCDFGCAFFLQTTLRSTMTARGSPFFMAPEMTLSDVKSCEAFPVDVYSFGVTMFYLIDPVANAKQLQECDWGSLPDVPLDVSELGRSCTQPNPRDRPTMGQIHCVLKHIVERLLP